MDDFEVVFEGLVITKKYSKFFVYIIRHGKPKKIHVRNCIITEECNYLFNVFTLVDCSITYCNLTAKEGLIILYSITPYRFISVDLSNNNLNGEGKKQFFKYLKSCFNYDCISHLNISGNGFTASDISDFGENDSIFI